MGKTRNLQIILLLAFLTGLAATAQGGIDDGLIAYYPFDGNANDLSGNGKHATAYNDYEYVPGVSSDAIRLVGSGFSGLNGGHVLLPSLPFENMSEFTIGLWVNHQGQTHTHGESFITYGNSSGNHVGIGYDLYREDDLRFNIGRGDGNIKTPYPSDFRGNWKHIVLRADHGTQTGFIDGCSIGSTSYELDNMSDVAGLGCHWWDGGNHVSSSRFIGMIDDVKIWDRALSNAEVALLSGGEVYTPINTTSVTEEPAPSLRARVLTTSNGTDRFIVFDGQGGWSPGGSIDQSKPTIVLSHGYASSYKNWPKDIADTMTLKGVDANIVAWDWEDDAAPLTQGGTGLLVDLGIAGTMATGHGELLGKRLLSELGTDYDQPIHFIGHSLGTRVNKIAADYAHSALDPQKTHVTIFDAAESTLGENLVPWSNPIPNEDVAYIDNFITAVGALHSEAVNVQLFIGQPDVTPSNLVEYHSLPTQWYRHTIENNSVSDVGNRWSFESGGFDGAPGSGINPETYYYQLDDPDEDNPELEWAVASQTFVDANIKQVSRDFQLIPGARQGMQLLENAIQGVRIAGTVTAGIAENIVDGSIVQSFVLNLISSSPAYAWATINVPNDAEYVTFDLLFEGLDEDDFFAFGIDDTLMLSLDLSHLENGELTNVGLLDVSHWAGTTVDFFYGLETEEAGREVSIENFVFMSPVPEPSTIIMLILGAVTLFPVLRRNKK